MKIECLIVLLALLQGSSAQFFTNCDVSKSELAAVNKRPLNDDVGFYCAHRGQPHLNVRVARGDAGLLQQLNVSLPITFMVHGFRESMSSSYYNEIKNEALTYQDINFCVVDWHYLANLNYPISAKQTERVGRHTADFIQDLLDAGLFSLKDITLVGYSLGAHVAGSAGARLNGALPLIIGVEAAGPCFSALQSSNRGIRSSDAQYVQAIHTDHSLCGSNQTVGDADYYVNGGINPQPGCSSMSSGGSLLSLFACSHFRGLEILKASMNPANMFLGTKCSSYSDFTEGECSLNPSERFGVYSKNKAKGKLYFQTNDSYPYLPTPFDVTREGEN